MTFPTLWIPRVFFAAGHFYPCFLPFDRQVWSSSLRHPSRLFLPPNRDLLMVSADQHLWHPTVHDGFRTRILRVFKLEYPQYTRPETVMNRRVPEVLVSGDHQKIAVWRQEQATWVTERRRPDLSVEGKKTGIEMPRGEEDARDPKSRKSHE